MKNIQNVHLLNGQLVSQNVLNWMDSTTNPRILNIFPQAINLINEARGVISILSNKHRPNPFSIILELNDLNFRNLMVEDANVLIENSIIKIGQIIIETEFSETWQPKIFRKSHTEFKQNFLNIFERKHLEKLINLSPYDSLLSIFDSIIANYSSHPTQIQEDFTSFQKFILKPANKFTEGIAHFDLKLIEEGASGLVGLGQGLTPSGDDFIVGGLFANWVLNTSVSTTSKIDSLFRNIVKSTTSLSAEWIKSACRGEFEVIWHDLAKAIRNENVDKFQFILEQILETGHSSGADALAGFFLVVFQFLKQSKFSLILGHQHVVF